MPVCLDTPSASHSNNEVPHKVGAAIVSSKGQILGRGHNTRVQTGTAIFHVCYSRQHQPLTDAYRCVRAMTESLQAETAAFEDSKSHKASDYLGATLYTTLSPCDMCAGACLLYNIKRVVIGENSTMSGREPYLKERGVEVVVLNNVACKRLL